MVVFAPPVSYSYSAAHGTYITLWHPLISYVRVFTQILYLVSPSSPAAKAKAAAKAGHHGHGHHEEKDHSSEPPAKVEMTDDEGKTEDVSGEVAQAEVSEPPSFSPLGRDVLTVLSIYYRRRILPSLTSNSPLTLTPTPTLDSPRLR